MSLWFHEKHCTLVEMMLANEFTNNTLSLVWANFKNRRIDFPTKLD